MAGRLINSPNKKSSYILVGSQIVLIILQLTALLLQKKKHIYIIYILRQEKTKQKFIIVSHIFNNSAMRSEDQKQQKTFEKIFMTYHVPELNTTPRLTTILEKGITRPTYH